MKIHEYQAKSLFKKYGIPIQDGYVIENINNAEETILKVENDFKSKDVVVKAQIHAGGRGKAGGIKMLKDRKNLIDEASKMFGKILITHQTGPQGKKVKRL